MYQIDWNRKTYSFDRITDARLFAVSKLKRSRKAYIEIYSPRAYLSPVLEETIQKSSVDGKKFYTATNESSINSRTAEPPVIDTKTGRLGRSPFWKW